MYNEIRNDYMYGPACGDTDEENGLFAGICIDGWKTDDDNEEGTVIAKVIMSKHGDLITVWLDNGARMQRTVLDSIAEAKAQLRSLWDEKHQMPEDDLAELADELKAFMSSKPDDRQSKLYLLKDNEGELALIRVNNWDDNFAQHLYDAADAWKASDGGLTEDLYGYLQVYGYDVDVLDYDDATL